MQGPLFHVIARTRWESLESLEEQPFIHLCTEAQLPGVLKRFFKGQTDLLLLTVDHEALGSHIKWEDADNDTFPHLYAPLEKTQVLGFRPLREEELS